MPLTTGIAAVTTAAWALAALLGGIVDVPAIGGFIPARVVNGFTVVAALPMVLTPLSATLIHGGFVHLAFNVLMLIWCGRQVEPALGWKMLALLYGIGAYAAAAGQWALDPGSTVAMVGASGSISALVGLYALVFSEQRVKAIGPVPGHIVRAIWLAAAWIGLQALIGFGFTDGVDGMAGVAVGAHIGGFVAGLLLARPMLRWRYRHA